jgi:hypothetical protein
MRMPGIIVQDDFGQYRTLDDELRHADGVCGARSYILDLMTAPSGIRPRTSTRISTPPPSRATTSMLVSATATHA